MSIVKEEKLLSRKTLQSYRFLKKLVFSI